MNRIGCAVVALSTFLTTACGDITGATGEKGRVNYSLYTHYEVDDWNLSDVSLVTGHPQLIKTEMTQKGEDQLDGEASDIVHTMDPAEGVNIVSADDSDIPDLEVTVSDAGDYTIKSELNGEIFDYLELSFDTPDALELINWVRNPAEEEFELAEGASIAINEGAQVTFLPVPSSGGVRLAGDITVDITADPESSVVRGENIWGVYEQNVSSSDQPVSLYFVEPGTVTITLSDGPNGVEVSQVFEVAAIVAE